MHVLIIYTGEFQTNGPTGGIFQLHQAKVLKNSKFKVGILNPNSVSPRYIFKDHSNIKHKFFENIPVFRLYKKNIFPGKIKFFNYFLKSKYEKITIELFDQYVKKYGKPDLCHVFDIRFGLVAGNIIKLKYKIPFIFTEYCVEIANNTLPLSKRYIETIVNPSLKNASKVALPSSKFAKKFKNYLKYKKKVEILPPVLPPDLNRIKKRSKSKNKDIFRFIIVSRLDKNKNVETPIKAFLKLNKKNVYLTIIGDGPEYSNLKKYFSDKRIDFLGNIPRMKMLKILAESDCIICSSFNETFGVGLIEACNFGLQIISSNCEGPSDIVNKINGLIIKRNDTKNFYLAMNKIIEGKSKFSKLRIITNNKKKFGNYAYIQKFKKITNSIINE